MNQSESRILVIDDDQWIVASTAMLLEAQGFSVSTARSGQEGLDTARRERPAVILLDVMMPDMDGFETLDRLKQDPATAEIPVVIFSARDPDQSAARSKLQGAAAFIHKPFEPARLIQVVRQYLLVSALG